MRDTGGDVVPLRSAAKVWALVSLQSFGGPAGQIAVMQRALVEERRWIGHGRFLHALNYCTILPGPEAMQLSVYIGWLLNGVRGGLLAGTLFVLPGAICMFVLSAVYIAFGTTTVVTALFAGIAPAVLAIVAQAVVKVGRRSLGRTSLVRHRRACLSWRWPCSRCRSRSSCSLPVSSGGCSAGTARAR